MVLVAHEDDHEAFVHAYRMPEFASHESARRGVFYTCDQSGLLTRR